MNLNTLKKQWSREENFAFKGWDFSHIGEQYESDELPWDYKQIVLSFLKSTDELLDIGTGGGEFLLSLHHPYNLTSVTESYKPNVDLCKKELTPLGITVVQTYDDDKLPFEDNYFDIIIDRHESFDPTEVNRVLKRGGCFITQQVGGMNNRDLSQRLIKNFVPKFPKHNLKNNIASLQNSGFNIIRSEEAFTFHRFFDVGALVYYAKIIEWEFPDFSIEGCFESLCECQAEIEKYGYIQGSEHRFIIVAQKL